MLDQRMATMDEKFDRQFEETRLFRQEMRAGFSELRAEMNGLRVEMNEGFAQLRAEMNGLRGEMNGGFSELRAEIVALHRQQTLILSGFVVGLLGLLGSQLF
jgi:hypothetical protein